MRSMVEGLAAAEEPLHRASRGPPPREISGRISYSAQARMALCSGRGPRGSNAAK
jgi:hypothetical protein